ncbi:MAG: hypothetical protein WCH34_04840 [Bacteroidota bacterium]
MKTQAHKHQELFKAIIEKGSFKQNVYASAFEAMRIIKLTIKELSDEYQLLPKSQMKNIPFKYQEKGDFQIELKFAGDIIIFLMHTNIFEFSRDHPIMKTHYIKEDIKRSYCGVIHIYNFLADSFKYNRINDSGYLIGRMFVNKDMHYFIEGKQELALVQNSFTQSEFNKDAANKLVEAAIRYSTSFDLLTPPYASIQEVTVDDMQVTIDNMKLKTAKRMGFRFHSDSDSVL